MHVDLEMLAYRTEMRWRWDHCPAEESEDPLDAALDAERMRNGNLHAHLLPYEGVQQRSRDRKGIRLLLYLFRGKFY